MYKDQPISAKISKRANQCFSPSLPLSQIKSLKKKGGGWGEKRQSYQKTKEKIAIGALTSVAQWVGCHFAKQVISSIPSLGTCLGWWIQSPAGLGYIQEPTN